MLFRRRLGPGGWSVTYPGDKPACPFWFCFFFITGGVCFPWWGALSNVKYGNTTSRIENLYAAVVLQRKRWQGDNDVATAIYPFDHRFRYSTRYAVLRCMQKYEHNFVSYQSPWVHNKLRFAVSIVLYTYVCGKGTPGRRCHACCICQLPLTPRGNYSKLQLSDPIIT